MYVGVGVVVYVGAGVVVYVGVWLCMLGCGCVRGGGGCLCGGGGRVVQIQHHQVVIEKISLKL